MNGVLLMDMPSLLLQNTLMIKDLYHVLTGMP